MKTFNQYSESINEKIVLRNDVGTFHYTAGVYKDGIVFTSKESGGEDNIQNLLNFLKSKVDGPWTQDFKYKGAGIGFTMDYYEVKRILE